MPDIFELMNMLCPDGVPYYRLDQVFDILQGYSPSMDKIGRASCRERVSKSV